MSLHDKGCQYIQSIVGDTNYRCHREVVGGSIYCPTHAVEYTIPQNAVEPISGVYLELANGGLEPLVARLVNKLRSLPENKRAALRAQLEQVLKETNA